MALPDQLLSDAAAGYDVVDEPIDLGSRSFIMTRVRNTNLLLDNILPESFARDERLPYWAELWPASVALAQFCLAGVDLAGKRVLELGCGLGLAGLAAASAGAHVILTDHEPDALRFARNNALKNLSSDVVDKQIEFCLLDWRSDPVVDHVDVILGSDIVYERRHFLPVLNFVRRVLKDKGRAIFSDPDRSTGMQFFALAEREGFDVTLSSQPLQYAGKSATILLGALQKKP